MKLSLAFAALSLFTVTHAFAGAANADLKCTARGLTIEGNIPGDFAEHDLTITSGGRKVRLASDGLAKEGSKLQVVDRMSDSVWTLSAQEGEGYYGWAQMYALPKTVKFKSTRNGYRATFKAKADVNFEQLGAETISATLDCSIVHEI
jgi:hypothetical protein